MQCVIYGNCQAVALTQLLYPSLSKIYIIHQIKPVHKLTNSDIDNLYKIIKIVDLLIIQPISDKYKNNIRLSTRSILENIKDECKVIMFPVCYFNFYYPFVTYLKTSYKEYYEYYQDINLINLYKSNKANIYDLYKQMIDNDKLELKVDPLLTAEKSLIELEKRECEMEYKYKKITIKISNFIRNNYRSTLLFYTRNHPTKYLLNFICKEICNILNIQYIENNIDPLDNKHPPLYKIMEKYVYFNINQYVPKLFDAIGIDAVIDKLLYSLSENKFIL